MVNSNGIQAALSNIERAAFRIPAKFAVASLGEATEEYLQEILNPVFRNLALGEDNEFKLFTEDAAYSALLAVLSVDVLEGPNIVSTDADLNRMGQTLRGQWGNDTSGVTRFLIDMGLKQERGTDAYQTAQAAQKQLDKGHALTNVTLGSLYQKVMGSLQAEGATIAAETGVDQQTAVTPEEQGFIEGLKDAPKEGTALVDVVRKSIPQMQDMAPVAEVKGNELPAGENVIERLTSFINRIGNKVHRVGFGDVLFSKGRIKNSMLGHGMGAAKIETFTAVPEVIKYGKQVDFQENWKGRGYDTYTFVAPVIYRGKPTYMGVIVTKDIQAERYYVHEVVDADGNLIFRGQENTAATSDGRASLSGTVDTVATTVFNHSIPQPPGKVKLQSAPDTVAGLGFQQGLDPGAGRIAQMKATLQGGVEAAAPEPSSPLETRLRQERGMDPDGGPDGVVEESDIGDAARRAVKNLMQRERVVGFAELPRKMRQTFESGLVGATPDAQKALQKIYSTTDYILVSGKHSRYVRGPENVILLSKYAPPSTLAHELFHRLDRGHKISRNFTESLTQDYVALNVRSGGDIAAYLLQEFPEAFAEVGLTGKHRFDERYRAISDMIHGLTDEQVFLGFGHPENYWKNPGAVEAEAWAQFGRVQFENQGGVLKMFQSLFPNFYESAIMVLKELI